MKRFPPALAVLAVLPLALACAPREKPAPGASPEAAAPAPIKVGVYGSLTGDTATFGQATKNGVALAVEEINAAGGVRGRRLETITEDDQGRPEEAAAVVQKLVNRDKVVVVIGEVASSRSLAAGPICQAAGIPMIYPSSTNPKVTQIGDYIFRACYTDDFQGAVMARFARQWLRAERAAILRDIQQDYSVGLADFFKKTFEEEGGKVVEDAAYSTGDKDFRGQLTKIRATRPDVVFVPGYYTEAGLVARQARELGITVPLVGGDGWESPRLLEIGGSALEGCYYGNHYFGGSASPRVQGFLAAYKAEFGMEPDAMAALAYDSAKLFAQALGATAGMTPKELRDELAATRGFLGVTGSITYDENRNPIKSVSILKVEGGKIVLATEFGGTPPPEGPSAPDAEAPPPGD